MLTPRLEVAHSAVYTADRPPRPADPASDPLAGRATLLAALPALLASTRVLTISGPPGVGKSALLAAAQRRTPAGHRVLALDTSPFETEGALLAALAEGAGAARPERAAVAVALEASPTLLVLDGVEGVRAAAAALATAAPRLRLLVGSTTPLGLPEEHVLRLAFLPAQRRALRMQASLPRALEASVRRCLERLSPAARAALEVAASPPRGPRLEDLRAALERRGLDPNLIEALRWRSLLCEDPARACPPPGVREALLDDGLEPDLERTWAEVLQDSLREAARAGEARTRAWAPDAEHILGLAGRLPPATAVGLLDAATPALAWHRPPGLGAALSAQLLDHARAAGDPEAAARGEAWSALFEVAFELPPDPLPVPTLGQGPEAALRAAAQALDHAARAEPHAALTWLTAARGQRLDPAHPAGAAAAWLLARAAAEAGWAPEARAEASRALTWARRAGHRTVEGLALVELAALSLAEDRAAEAAARMAEAEGAGEWCQPGLLVQRATLAALAGGAR